ncbi:MAG: hypothetical protein P4L83_00545 [Nevskia sp.]|nr:hypothetical protein [Nevskia sp.]
MDRLQEVPRVRQVPGEPRRRWFSARDMDLIVWIDDRELPFAFQLCYMHQRREFALEWERDRGYAHTTVDDGEGRWGMHKATPILDRTAPFDPELLRPRFDEIGSRLPTEIRCLVGDALANYPESPPAREGRSLLLCIRLPAIMCVRWWKGWAR